MDGAALPGRFEHPDVTARGERRAHVALSGLHTLWFNTGTLCNITCTHCYIESSPRNDRLAYLTADDVRPYLDEIAAAGLPTTEVGFTGGEPFMNAALIPMLRLALSRGFSAIVLTNAMQPMTRWRDALASVHRDFPGGLTVRVSVDHADPATHDAERGAGGYARTLDGLRWLASQGIETHVAGRLAFGASEAEMRDGFARVFAANAIPIDARDPVRLMLFPEMDAAAVVPEITEACWGILHKSPDSVMCASSRMVVRRQGADRAAVLACTLLPYDPQFELGATLADAAGPVKLNHPHCAKFCVLGGAACSR